MIHFLGYSAHLASVALHRVALRSLESHDRFANGSVPRVYVWRDQFRYYDPIALRDVAPFLVRLRAWVAK